MNPEKIINLPERKAALERKIFSDIAEEIRSGGLQTHFGDNNFLFAKTEDILHFALEGEKLDPDSKEYNESRATAGQEILKNVNDITEVLSRYPENDCQAVRESLTRITSLAQKFKTTK